MSARRRIDRLTQRLVNTTGATDAYEAHQRARLDAMTDEQLQAALDVHLEVLAILDAAGALEMVLAENGMTDDAIAEAVAIFNEPNNPID